MSESEVICEICGEAEPPKLVVVKNGIGTLVHSSKLRDDALHNQVLKKTTVRVHADCRKNYINPKYIETDRKRREEAKNTYALRPSRDERFDFITKCMICGKSVPSLEQRERHPERHPVSVVTTLVMHDSVWNAALSRNDSWGKEARDRIAIVIDLVAAEGRYHRRCYALFRNPRGHMSVTSPLITPGRKKDVAKLEAFNKLCAYLEQEEECQFDMESLVQKMRDLSPLTEPFTAVHLARELKNKYHDNIFFSSQKGLKTIVCLKGTAEKLLNKKWYNEQRAGDPREERLRVVETAANIVREDIRSMAYDTSRFPSVGEIASGGQDLVPETLQNFVETVACKGKKGDPRQMKRKCIALEHGLIQLTRPRSFLSPVHFGLVVMLHKTYGSRYLIDTLNSIGFCSSYNEVTNYEAVVALTIEIKIDLRGFLQFVYDNVDINVRTLDGHNTVHCMGGVQCVTPSDSVSVPTEIPRGNIQLTGHDNFRRIAEIPVQFRKQGNKGGLMSVQVKICDKLPGVDQAVSFATYLDSLWLAATWVSDDAPFPGWSGYMTAATQQSSQGYETSAIIPTPFVNLQPSNPTTIYTCLKYAAEKCKERQQGHCLVTFDQPLFHKAMAIVLAEPSLSSVIPRLGGFHQLMSFQGAVGFIMAGSGIEYLWETIYAKNTVCHMMSGHAFSRALRAHFLTQQALIHLLLESLPAKSFPKEAQTQTRDVPDSLMAGQISCEEAVGLPCVRDAHAVLQEAMQRCSETRMGRLWVGYIRMVQIMRNFVRAERCGHWKLHIHSAQEMIPYFFASGHLHYAKSSLLYLQTMETLETRMSVIEFDRYTSGGFFTIRRSDKFWGGIWTDLTIEQTLMRKLKARGGLTQGRGTGPGAIAKFLHTATATFPVMGAIEAFCNVRSESSEQHKELRESRIKRDRSDLDKILAWLSRHSPFGSDRSDDALVSLSTGAIADDAVDCDAAQEVGAAAMQRAVGTSYGNFHIKKSDRVKSLASMSLTIKTKKGEALQVNPNQLFHRLICVLERKQNLDLLPRCFAFELSVRPPALFDNALMRQGTKSTLVEQIERYVPATERLPNAPIFTIDRGFLLHKVTWPSPATFFQVCETYVAYVNSFGESRVVFDGYGSPSTKDECHLRRQNVGTSTDLDFQDGIFVTVARDRLLNNEGNKVKFIELLTAHLHTAGIPVIQGKGDADALVVRTAISVEGRNSVVVGEDTDLLVLLIGRTPQNRSTYMFKPKRDEGTNKVFDIRATQQAIGDLKDLILVFHAFTGCDTTSAPYMRGKLKSWQKLEKFDVEFKEDLQLFNSPSMGHYEIATIGERFMLQLYSAPAKVNSLDDFRFPTYQRLISKKSPGAEFHLAALPPTSAAARQHSFRCYFQVQDWLGSPPTVTDWGWTLQGNRLTPVTTERAPAPEDLLGVVFCNCPNDCGAECDCRVSGLPCSAMCGFCGGTSCDNMSPELESEDDMDDPDDPSTM